MRERITAAQAQILLRQFRDTKCPVCQVHTKQSRQCFCRTCYFALPAEMRSRLYVPIANGDEFFENYALAKEWLRIRGMGTPEGWRMPA